MHNNNNNNNNNSNNHDNLYGAIIMTKVIARVLPVHLMNADWAPGGRQPSDQASRLGLSPPKRKFAATIHIHHRHYYYYSAHKLILIYRPTEDGRPSRPTHCSKGAQPVPKAVYRSSCRDKHNRRSGFEPGSSHTAVGRANQSATETYIIQYCNVLNKLQSSRLFPPLCGLGNIVSRTCETVFSNN